MPRLGIGLLLVGLAAAALVGLRFGVDWLDKAMRADPRWQPPSWQIRLQARQMAEAVVPDPVIGFRVVAHQDQWVETEDFRFRRRTGEFGFPHLGPWPSRADIVMLGDSLLLGEGVGAEASFVQQIDDALPAVDLVNLGNPGAGAERQLRIFGAYGADLGAKWVISCLYLGSDMEGDRHFRAWVRDSLGMDYNAFRLSFARRTDKRPPRDLLRRLEQRPTFGWLRRFGEPLLWGDRHYDHVVDVGGQRLFSDRAKIREARRTFADSDPELQSLTEALFKLRKTVNNHGALLAVAFIPSKEEVYGLDRDERQASGVQTLMRILTDENIPTLDLEPAIRRRANEPAYFKRDVHLNGLGNELVAEAMADWITRELLTESS